MYVHAHHSCCMRRLRQCVYWMEMQVMRLPVVLYNSTSILHNSSSHVTGLAPLHYVTVMRLAVLLCNSTSTLHNSSSHVTASLFYCIIEFLHYITVQVIWLPVILCSRPCCHGIRCLFDDFGSRKHPSCTCTL